jgi:uncharacterized protein YcsI (UPF0317 family)
VKSEDQNDLTKAKNDDFYSCANGISFGEEKNNIESSIEYSHG